MDRGKSSRWRESEGEYDRWTGGESSCWRSEGGDDRWTRENPRVGENLREKMIGGLGRILVLERT